MHDPTTLQTTSCDAGRRQRCNDASAYMMRCTCGVTAPATHPRHHTPGQTNFEAMKNRTKSLNEGTTNQDPNTTGNAGVTNTPPPIGPGDQPPTLPGHLPEQWPVDRIKPHPINATLYGDTCDEALIESIKEQGILDPLVILPDGTLLGGHRRLAAAQQLKMTTVPVHIMPVSDERDPVGVIIGLNVHRPKTPAMKVREYAALLEIEARKAKGRQGRRNILPDLAGSARENAALKVGLKHSTAENGLKVLTAIEKHSDDPAVTELLDLMNRRSVDAAFKKAQVIGWIPHKPRKPRAGEKQPSSPKDEQHTNSNTDRPLTEVPEAPPANEDHPLEAVTPPAPPMREPQGEERLGADVTVPDGPMPGALPARGAVIVKDMPPSDVPATTIGNPQATAGQFIYNSAQAPVLIVDGWRDGLISEQQVREDVTSLDGNAKGDSPHDVAETQRLVVQLAGFVNGVVPANANAATLSNLCDAAKRLNTIALTLLLKKTPRQTPGSSTVHRQSNITHQPK